MSSNIHFKPHVFKALVRATEDNSTDAYYRFVVTLLGTLTFALEWEELSSGPGGSTRVANAYQKMFYLAMDQPSLADAALAKAAAAWVQENKQTYKEWRVSNEPVVTGRNRVLGAYRTVRYIFHLLLDFADAVSLSVRCRSILGPLLVDIQSERQSSHTTLETRSERCGQVRRGEERCSYR